MKFATLTRFLYRRYALWAWALLVGFTTFWSVRACQQDDQHWQFADTYRIRLPMRYGLHGIDVSHHNRRINWASVRQTEGNGVRLTFAFIKATEGATHLDRQFARNWREARAAGLRRGAYHFYHPRRDPQKQAANFVRHVTLAAGDFAPVLDFEHDGNQPDDVLISGLRTWLETVEAHYGVKPIIYTNQHFYERYVVGNFDDYPLWIADYSDGRLARYNRNRLYLWQHSKSGWVAGVRGPVDFNVFVQDPDNVAEICL